jgi:hypothetical protein
MRDGLLSDGCGPRIFPAGGWRVNRAVRDPPGADGPTRCLPASARRQVNPRARRWLAWLDVALKAILAALLAYSVAAPDLPHLAGKAMTARALLYPLAAAVVPVAWWARGRRGSYPYGLDALVTLPFVIDTAGNAADLYATVWFDALAHAVNWALIVAAFGAAVGRLGLARWNVAALALGFGATTHVLWELVEYGLQALGSSGLQLTYRDTIADLGLSLLGTAVAALAAGLLASPPAPGRRPPGGATPRPRAPATSRGSRA